MQPPTGQPFSAIGFLNLFGSENREQIQWALQNIPSSYSTATVSRGPGSIPLLPKSNGEPLLGSLTFKGPNEETVTVTDALEKSLTDGVIVLHKGQIVLERYFNGFTRDGRHLWFSCSKSLLGILVGILQGEGALSLSDPVTKYVPELESTAYAGVSIEDCLSHHSGVKFNADPFTPGADLFEQLVARGAFPRSFSAHADAPHSSRAFIRQRLLEKDAPAGTKFNYNEANTDVLAWVVENICNKSVAEVTSEKVWSKLGADQDGQWVVDSEGTAAVPHGFISTLRDAGRFGQMLLQEGQFNGSQIVPAEWVRQIMEPSTMTDENIGDAHALREFFCAMPLATEQTASGLSKFQGYKHQFWLMRWHDDAYEAFGFRGQYIIIDPTADMVIARFGSEHSVPSAEGCLFHAAVQAIADALSASTAGPDMSKAEQ